MTMNFNAKEAAKTTYNAFKAESERMLRCAETTISHLIEPQIQQAANMGKSKMIFSYHETQSKLYEKIRDILIENGYKATCSYKEGGLIVKWDCYYFGA